MSPCGKAGHTARDCRMKSLEGRKRVKRRIRRRMEGQSCGVSTVVEEDTCQCEVSK